MCLAQGPQRSDAGEARTRGPSVIFVYDKIIIACRPKGGTLAVQTQIRCGKMRYLIWVCTIYDPKLKSIFELNRQIKLSPKQNSVYLLDIQVLFDCKTTCKIIKSKLLMLSVSGKCIE